MFRSITISIFFFLQLALYSYGQEIKNVTLLDNWFQDSLLSNSSLVRYSGCWGFEQKGQEYAIIGSTEGTHFFSLTEENKFKSVGYVQGRYSSSMVIHREFKTYKNYAYSICDEGLSSLQIIDLSFLPDSVHKVADIQNEDFGRVHNLYIDTNNALLYACLVTPIINGILQSKIPMRVFSLTDPLNPTLLWEGPSDIPEVHDCYVRGNIAILNCGQDGLRVYNFADPVNPLYLSNMPFYQDQGYNHQGWLSPDGKTYVFADETEGKRVKKCTVGNNWIMQTPKLFGTNYENNSVPHNIMCTNEFAFIAYYNEGLRIFDIRNNLIEIGAYDTYLNESQFKMNGAWGVFANYESERIIVSDRQSGLFLFDFDREIFINQAASTFNIYPNPSLKGESFLVRSMQDEISEFKISVYNNLGQMIMTHENFDFSYMFVETPNSSGSYHVVIEYKNYLDETVQEKLKFIVL